MFTPELPRAKVELQMNGLEAWQNRVSWDLNLKDPVYYKAQRIHFQQMLRVNIKVGWSEGRENSQVSSVSDSRWAQAGDNGILPVQREILPGCMKTYHYEVLNNCFIWLQKLTLVSYISWLYHPVLSVLTYNPIGTILLSFFFLINLFIYLFLAVLGLRFCTRAFPSCGERGPLFIAVRGPLTVTASPVAEHRLQTRRLSSCGSRA